MGENWQILTRSEKEPFETQAATLKAQFNVQLAKYKETDSYKEYQQYAIEFKAKTNANQNSGGYYQFLFRIQLSIPGGPA